MAPMSSRGKDPLRLLAAKAQYPEREAASVDMALDGFPVYREQPRQLRNIDGHIGRKVDSRAAESVIICPPAGEGQIAVPQASVRT